MASTDTPVGALSALYQAVQAQTDTVKNFKDEQINVFTTQQDTATVTDSDGNPVVVPSWKKIAAEAAAGGTPAPSPSPSPAPVNVAGMVTRQSQQPGAFLSTPSLTPYLGDWIQYWNDPTDSGVQAYYSVDASIDTTGTIASAVQLSMISYFMMQGRLPTFGKWWFSASFPVANPGNNSASIAFTQDPTWLSTDQGQYGVTESDAVDKAAGFNTPVFLTSLGIGAGHVSANGQSSIQIPAPVVAQAAQGASLSTVLICVDVDNSQVSYYTAAGLLATVPVSTDRHGRSLLANACIVGSIDAIDSTVSVSFNFTDATSTPYAVPAGFNPLVQSQSIDELGLQSLDHSDYSNPFISHAWVGPNGELLGGFSTVTGQLWLARGGFIANDIASLKDVVERFNMPDISVKGIAGNLPSLNQPATAGNTTTMGGINQRYFASFAHGTAGWGNPVGIRAIDGALEVYGQDLLRQVMDLRANGNNAKRMAYPSQVLLIGDDTTGEIVNQIGTYADNWLTWNGMTSTEVAMLAGAVPILVTLLSNTLYASGQSVLNSVGYLDNTGTYQSLALNSTFVQALVSEGVTGRLGNGHYVKFVAGPSSEPSIEPLNNQTVDVLVPPNESIMADNLIGRSEDCVAVVMVGGQNITATAQIQADIQAIVQNLRYLDKQFVIVTPFDQTNAGDTGPNAASVSALEEWIAFHYPKNHINARYALYNSQGSTYPSGGIQPAAVFVAGTGLTAAGGTALSNAIGAKLTAMGVYQNYV